MIKILFICHGNICRSPMAEYIFKKIINEQNLSDMFVVDSAATSREEIGNDIYPPAKEVLKRHGVPFDRRRARQITRNDFDYYDYIVTMEQYNNRNIQRLLLDVPMEKVSLLMSYTGEAKDVSDPWYTGDFDQAFDDIDNGCRALLKEILKGIGK